MKEPTMMTKTAPVKLARNAALQAISDAERPVAPDVRMAGDWWDDRTFERAISLGKLRRGDAQCITVDVTPIAWQKAVTSECGIPLRWSGQLRDCVNDDGEYTAELVGVRRVLGRLIAEFEVEAGDNLRVRCHRCHQRISEAGPVGAISPANGVTHLFCGNACRDACRDAWLAVPHRLAPNIESLRLLPA